MTSSCLVNYQNLLVASATNSLPVAKGRLFLYCFAHDETRAVIIRPATTASVVELTKSSEKPES